ncbi:ABC-type amino acid transport system, permease component [Lachnospiraceae bacterium NE2001]|nr:ABC-type amino acid transport system, permease component [Lachnospiraceae bacterium NE2001]
MKNKRRLMGLLMVILCTLLFVIPAYAKEAESDGSGEPEFASPDEMGGATVGLLTGMPFEDMISQRIPDIGGFAYFASMPDEVLALKARKIDAIFINNALIDFAAAHNPDLVKMDDHYLDSNFGFAFPKGDPQRDVWGAIIDRMKEDGTIDELWVKWMESDDPNKSVPEQDWPGNAGTVRVACADSFEPMSYYGENGEMMGFDVEILLNVAKELDLKVEFTPMEFGALMPTIQSGKADVAIGDIVITDERAEIVDFAPYAPAYFTMLIRNSGAETVEDKSFLQNFKDSFERTFITEDRYKMILQGLGMTALVALSSAAIGLALAYGLIFLRRANKPFTNRLISGYNALIAGIPAAVILMLLYYIVFASAKFSAVVVAIVGFALIYCSRAYGIIWNAVSAVDEGQREAALALGYTESLAFRKVILPQSESYYTPLLFSQFILLLKETSVAGYITVLDLTRAGDLIRSRTMEAFFPLISVAVIYFFLTFLMTRIARKIDVSFKDKYYNHKIKGVDE